MNSFRALTPALFRAFYRDRINLCISVFLPLVLLLVLDHQVPNSANQGIIRTSLFSVVICFSTCFIGAFNSTMNFTIWRENGMMRVLRNSPISSLSVVLSALCVSLLLSIVQYLLIIAVLYTPVVSIKPAGPWIFTLLPICFGVSIFFELGSIIPIWVHSIPAAIAISSIVVVLFVYCSGTFFPSSFLPAWVNSVAPYTPFRALVDSVQYLTFGIGDANTFLKGGLVIVCWFTPLSLLLPRALDLDK
ncbi:ABC transporter permease [Bifidobacterium asteroides]|uniref:ABC transporter permease n=1 Tax=Bifidobacterium asteroides TaxID=1684 RepID=UPI001C6A0B9F|nr:ABC transporter permease [Bifidobacterium asteroides]